MAKTILNFHFDYLIIRLNFRSAIFFSAVKVGKGDIKKLKTLFVEKTVQPPLSKGQFPATTLLNRNNMTVFLHFLSQLHSISEWRKKERHK